MFGDVVMGVERHYFEEILDKYKKKSRVKNDTELTTDQLKKIVEEFKAVYKKNPRKLSKRSKSTTPEGNRCRIFLLE